jgi:hypothetical protein
VSTTDREGILKAPLISETLEALGFLSPFDTAHEVTNLMGVWETRLKNTEMFNNYAYNVRLFHQKGINGEWDQNKISKAINMVLGAVGLKLESIVTQSRTSGTRSRQYRYVLNAERVAEMLNLVKLKLRSSTHRGSTPNMHARRAIYSPGYGKYDHLIDSTTTQWCEYLFDD